MLVLVPQRPPRAGWGFIDLICWCPSLPPLEFRDYKRQSEVGESVGPFSRFGYAFYPHKLISSLLGMEKIGCFINFLPL